MNLPQYGQAVDAAAREYLAACEDARERMLKALAVAKQEFFEDPVDSLKAVQTDENFERRR